MFLVNLTGAIFMCSTPNVLSLSYELSTSNNVAFSDPIFLADVRAKDLCY